MNNVVRWRFPARVCTLLSDIAHEEVVKQVNDCAEPESVTRDEISLCGSSVSNIHLTSSGDGKEGKGRATSLSDRPCEICLSKASRYTCPRCNMPYCGLTCYKSPMHSACSEEFYKECVSQELKCQGVTENKEKMQEILLRLRHRTDDKEMENVLKDLVGENEESITGQDVQAIGLLSRLAEIQASGKEEHAEIEEILQKLKQSEEVTEGNKLHEEMEGLAVKLSGVNIDTLTEEELWSMLPSKHKKRFEELVKGGAIGALVPQWSPWWERHEQDTKALIEDLQSKENSKQKNTENETKNAKEKITQCKDTNITQPAHIRPQSEASQAYLNHQKILKVKGEGMSSNINVLKSAVPPISANIPALTMICSNPSPLVQFNLLNILYGYSFCLCFYNGDISESEQLQEFCQSVLFISECLGSGRVCHSVPEALEAGAMAIASRYLNQEDPAAPTRAVNAVAHILTGESREDPTGYTLAALTQLGEAFRKAKGLIPKDEEPCRRKYFLVRRKCEFLQSWVKKNSDVLRSLAALAWNEYSRICDERRTLEREKKGLEKVWKNRTGRGKILIQEIK